MSRIARARPRTVRHRANRNPSVGFRRVLAALAFALVAVLAWRAGWLGANGRGTRISASPVSARGGLAGPPAASAEEIDATLDRLIGLGEPVLCGGGTEPLVALTFDDGPGPYTQATVDILEDAGARATFFIVGRELVDWPDLADMPKQETSLAAIGNHTWDHADLVGVGGEQLRQEMAYSQRFIAGHAGQPVRLFRPPYGHHDEAVDQMARDLGMLEVLWTVDSRDGTTTTGEEVLANVESGLRPGAIVLLHENRGTTLNMLPRILRAIGREGLRPVTVPELLAADPPTTEQLQSGTCH